ncbi:hypothetical protein [Halobacteriovorax sp. JY17]|uniref:hypothetical protein n=1 Tax=Halobacteriovorax sp. JY17 TaxID=2014617 RepID=UPI000C460763|nr:hypothetical protein [Halobacteriovorax sp. JY17]PIK14224.1 MAG: hypothetical protein CES88_14700 [Halobacteriovorax sp. JY17]
MKSLFLLIFIVLLSSCSTKREYSYSSVYEGVDLSTTESKHVPLIESKGQTQSYGPILKEDSDYVNQKSEKIKALFLYPGAMTSITYLKFVDNLQKYKLEPSVYSGAGFSAVIAAFLAKGLTTDHIEWKIFSLLESLKEVEYYSSDWKEIMYKFLKSEFKEDKLEGLKKALVLPIYDKKLQKVRYLSRGNLYNVLLINLELDNTTNDFYQSPVTSGNLDIESLKSNGVDRIAVLNTLGQDLNFFKTNHYLIGLYGKMIGYAKIESERNRENVRWFNLKRNNVELDRIVDLQDLLQTTMNKNENILKELRDFFKKE